MASAVVAAAPAPAPLTAQDLDWERTQRHRLTTAELDAFIPYLEARADAWYASSASITRGQAAFEAYGARWKAGEDPLPFLEGLADALPLPPGAAYAEECSRGLTSMEEQPIAIFTFGIQASEAELAAAGQSDWQPENASDMGARWERVDSVQKAGVRFYASRGWGVEGHVARSPEDRLSVSIETTNPGAMWTRPEGHSYALEPEFQRVRARVHAACAAAGWGPSLRVWAPNQAELGIDPGDPDAAPALPAQLDEAYFALVVAAQGHQMGLTEAALEEALEEARGMAEVLGDPTELELERIRQANLALYRRHAQRDRLQRVIGRLEGW
jgi:hypothetical protein